MDPRFSDQTPGDSKFVGGDLEVREDRGERGDRDRGEEDLAVDGVDPVRCR
jgi:hypothetical protein